MSLGSSNSHIISNQQVNLQLSDYLNDSKVNQQFQSDENDKTTSEAVNPMFRHSCDTCDDKFHTKAELNKHKFEIHDNLKILMCEICSKKFSQKTHLVKHQKVHDKSRPRPFKCQKCEFATHCKQNFDQHQRKHVRQAERISTMLNPVKCDDCDALCGSKEALRNHRKYVHPKKLFDCSLCGKMFKTASDLKKHVKRVHNKMDVTAF